MAPSRRTLLAAAPGLLLAERARAAAPADPSRIVSLNPCLDAVLVEVCERERIAALSHYARDPQGSTIAPLARTLPQTFESAEEVLMLRPDLVLASLHTSPATLAALQRFGVRPALFGVPASVEENLAQITQIARLVGRPRRGADLVARIRAALGAAAPPAGEAPVEALVFQPRGFAAGEGTLMSEMLARTGFRNVAERYGLKRWGNVSLERLVADPPRMLLCGEAAPGAPSWGDRLVTHPALRALRGRMARATLPERLLYCGGPALITTARLLSAARAQLRA